MEIFGGFMVMMSILSFFMAIVWLIMPFVVFTIKGKLDKTLDVLNGIEKRLAGVEKQLTELQRGTLPVSTQPTDEPAVFPSDGNSSGDSSLPLA